MLRRHTKQAVGQIWLIPGLCQLTTKLSYDDRSQAVFASGDEVGINSEGPAGQFLGLWHHVLCLGTSVGYTSECICQS